MNARKFLGEYQKINSIIENKLIELEQLKQIARSVTGGKKDGEKVQAQGNPQKMADAVVRYIDAENAINDYIDKLIDKKNEIISVIEQLPADEYDVLHKIYIQGLKMSEAAKKKKKSYSMVKTCHYEGLQKVEKILEKNFQNRP